MPTNTPTVSTWNRLEPRPRQDGLGRALRAEVRDALWLLTRQWQVGEFKAEDAGSPILAELKARLSTLKHYAPAQGGAASTLTAEVPLEVLVEREAAPLDLGLRLEMGRHFLRMLRARLDKAGQPSAPAEQALLAATRPIRLLVELPPQDVEHAALHSQRRLTQALALAAAGRALDGGTLYTYLTGAPGRTAADFLEKANPAVTEAGRDLVAWFQRVFSQPDGGGASPAWQPEALAYRFAVSAPQADRTSHVLASDAYHHGELDWYAFDHEPAGAGLPAGLRPASPDTSGTREKNLTALATPLRFPGMPHARWWEMEEGRVDLADIDPQDTNTAHLLFAEFALLSSNDWLLIPLVQPVGSLCELREVVVTDVFGQRTRSGPAGRDLAEDWKRFSLFTLGRRDGGEPSPRLFLPPTLDRPLEADPFEEARFLRDEMANMAWAVETVVPDGLGEGQDGSTAALRLRQYLETLAAPAPASGPSNGAALTYRLASEAPEHWIPFVAVHAGVGSRQVKLQRSAMPRLIEGLEPMRVTPRTGIVFQPPSPSYIHEEEVPRAGAIVTRGWQRARWFNGATFTWVGRRKQTGRGEGASGLRWDEAVPRADSTRR
ncbi:hypothetical protein P2318_17915 [Myxococcaceae bacterium GXIMD 01537]